MCNNRKKHTIGFIAASLFINIVVANFAYSEETDNQTWTKYKVQLGLAERAQGYAAIPQPRAGTEGMKENGRRKQGGKLKRKGRRG